MDNTASESLSFKPFAESDIWQLNRDYYEETGIDAWRSGVVPHHMTSNSMVGRTYAELILAFLYDVAEQVNIIDTVYILELGAGHGRLAYHILQHLEKLIQTHKAKLPPFCYILSDIVEEDLLFYKNHLQLKKFFDLGILDVAYFDAVNSKEIKLWHADKTIGVGELKQPIVALGNYFFDSLPVDLFRVQDHEMASCAVSVSTTTDPEVDDFTSIIKSIKLEYQSTPVVMPFYADKIENEILSEYLNKGLNTYLFFPRKSMHCLDNLAQLSEKGLMALSMDKGYHEMVDIDNQPKPNVIKHGSFSFWVNYHGLGAYCNKKGGISLFPNYSTFHIELTCFLMLDHSDHYRHTAFAYERFVNDFGPDDIDTIKKLAYKNAFELELFEIIALIRMAAYDSSFFMKFLPRIKILIQNISIEDRRRLSQILSQVGYFYFHIGEPEDVAYEIGGIYYDLGYYEESLMYFQTSIMHYGHKEDAYYNMGLCYYNLRMDVQFVDILTKVRQVFPHSPFIAQLEKLDLLAV